MITTSTRVFCLVTAVLFLTKKPFLAHGLPDQSLSFVSFGVDLEPQEKMPEMLHPYHSKSLEMSESAFQDTSLVCARAVPYGPMEHQLLDVWAPRETTKDRIIVVLIHGGGWDWGYREYVGFCAKILCKDSNAIVVAPSYALGKGTSKAWPQSRDDIVEVLRWITSEPNDWIASNGGNPRKIVLSGHSAGGHLAACVGLDENLLSEKGIDPSVVKALFLISCPMGVRAEDFFVALARRKWIWKTVGRPLAKFIYQRVNVKFLRPILGSTRATGDGVVVATKESIRKDADEASPLKWLSERRRKLRNAQDSSVDLFSPLVHISYAKEQDFSICAPHANTMVDILGKDTVKVLELPVVGHLESHFALAHPDCEWYDAFRKTMSSL